MNRQNKTEKDFQIKRPGEKLHEIIGFSQREYKEESHTKCCIKKEGCQESIKSTTIKLRVLTRLDYN